VHNIRAAKDVDFQIATEAFRGSWREPEGKERDKVWQFMVEFFPPYADYQAATDRQIPLIMRYLRQPAWPAHDPSLRTDAPNTPFLRRVAFARAP